MSIVLGEKCKKEREEYLKEILKTAKLSRFKKCDTITDFKKQNRCRGQEYKKYIKSVLALRADWSPRASPAGKKQREAKKKANDCMDEDVKKKGCLGLRRDSIKASKQYGIPLFREIKKMMKICNKLTDDEKKRECGKKYLQKIESSTKLKRLALLAKTTEKAFQKCMK